MNPETTTIQATKEIKKRREIIRVTGLPENMAFDLDKVSLITLADKKITLCFAASTYVMEIETVELATTVFEAILKQWGSDVLE